MWQFGKPGMIAGRAALDATPGYSAVAVLFDGTNDYASGSITAPSGTSKVGVFSCWFRITGANGNYLTFLESGAGTNLAPINVYRWGPDDKIHILGKNSSAVTILDMQSTGTYRNGMGWSHLLMSWDLAAGTAQMYIDDVDVRAAAPTVTNDNIAWGTTMTVGGRSTGVILMQGDLADLYVNSATALDLSNSANRRKFITAGLKPVSLGANGSTPTGAQPDIFLSNPVASWHTNLGSGGGFTLTGALTASSSSPSD